MELLYLIIVWLLLYVLVQVYLTCSLIILPACLKYENKDPLLVRVWHSYRAHPLSLAC
jgi:lysophospholipid acyltransferase (LPLAT)-like uncharacterized protein